MDSRLVCLVVFVISSAVPYTKANGVITPLNYNFTHSDCGTTKLCVEKPTSCNPSGTSECFFASTRINQTDKSLAIELSGSSDGYIALAAGSSTNVSQGSNTVFVCGNNNGTFFFKTATFTNNILVTTNSTSVSDIQYSLKNQSLIQCAFTIPITSNNTEALNILGINVTMFNISNPANPISRVFLEVYKGSYNGTDFGEHTSAFGSSVSVNLADVKSSGITTKIPPTAAPTIKATIKPTSNGNPLLLSHAALGLLAAVALRFV
ncbi:putative ferric-chelate reductase 1 [Triplophysa dalaica]|uniref:putative ferric-chelate reductase 1 n=1 Tax=Triplophysa dalaica TaxID=1582913 RepID=UPI0024DFCE98|nr:putative ferric-chelate reductase 1 [Triplophysa dalaica]